MNRIIVFSALILLGSLSACRWAPDCSERFTLLPYSRNGDVAFDKKTGRKCYTREGINYDLPTCHDLYLGKNPKRPKDIFDQVGH